MKCMPKDAVNEQLVFLLCFIGRNTIFFTIGFVEARRFVRRDRVETSYNFFRRKMVKLDRYANAIVGCSSRMRWLSTLCNK